MYLIQTDDPMLLKQWGQSIDFFDHLNDFVHCDLGRLNTLELTELCDQSASWLSGPPLVYDETIGLAIFSFSWDGLTWLLDHIDFLEKFDVDIHALQVLARVSSVLYLVDTF